VVIILNARKILLGRPRMLTRDLFAVANLLGNVLSRIVYEITASKVANFPTPMINRPMTGFLLEFCNGGGPRENCKELLYQQVKV